MSEIAFATPTVGFLFGPALLVTTDAGRTWTAVRGAQTEALGIAGNEVYRIVYRHTGCPGPCAPMLEGASIDDLTWRTLLNPIDAPDRNDAATIVGSGANVLIALYGSQAGPVPALATVYRSTDGGQTWQRRTDPCSGSDPKSRSEEDLVDVAVAPGGFIAGLCTPHVHGETFAVGSSDDGASWHRSADLPSGLFLGLIAAADPTTFAVVSGGTSGDGPTTARLFGSNDAGRHWRPAGTDAQQITQVGVPAWIGFQSPQHGVWISGPDRYSTTTDGGRTWVARTFP